MYDRILVPLDGSPFAEQVLPLAASIARRSGMGLELLKVRHATPVAHAQDTMLAAQDADARDRERSARYLAHVAGAVADETGLSVRTSLLDDPFPVTAICEEAARSGATLIAMTTHGRTGMLRAMRGSVADGVLHHAAAPVLLWRPTDPPQPVPTSVEHVLVPLDGSTWGEMILPVAAALASLLGARLSLVRVVMNVPALAPAPFAAVAGAPFTGLTWLPADIDRSATRRAVARARGYLAEVADQLRAAYPGLLADVHAIADDEVPAAILQLARDVHADVLAMTTHARGVSRLVVGSMVDEILHRRAGATLLLRPTAPVADGRGSAAVG